MARAEITDAIQTSILLKSRRRCCLCFWLQGIDEVKKGQMCHIDGNHSNSTEANLAFMCMDHHDEYDSTTRLSKGLKPAEIKRYRDELYREMEYRFRTIKRHGFELTITRFTWLDHGNDYCAEFRLKNTGEVAERSPTVAIRLPEDVGGKLPQRFDKTDLGFGAVASMPIIDIWAADEEKSDLFEPDGRIAVQVMGGANPVLMPGHTFDFEALVFNIADFDEGTPLILDYRVDAEGSATVEGKIETVIPPLIELLTDNEED